MRLRLSGLVAIGVAIASAAHAQPSEPGDDSSGYIGKEVTLLEIDDCPPNPDVSADELRKIGGEHFQRGEVLYVQGDYKGAVKELVAAYCIAPSFYSILKDVGQAYERELEYEKAIAYLERFVTAVPKDAKRANNCAADPQDEKRNVLARLNVLKALKAKLLIITDPPSAKVTLSNDAGIAGRGRAGQELEVQGGKYDVLIEADGFKSTTQTVTLKIGKPFTFFTELQPLKGTLRIRVVPATARIFLDQKQVATGAYEAELPGKKYTIAAEAEGRVAVQREIEVIANRDTPVSFELPPEPQFGRNQLLVYAGLGGALAGGFLGAASENPAFITGGVIGGGIAGFTGTLFGTSRRIPLGTSSLTITSSLVGGTVGGASALLFTNDPQRYLPAIGGGLILGAGIGYYAGSRFSVTPGDAAVVNSGALWGAVTASLFVGSFAATDEDSRKIGAGIVLSGIGMGTLGGALISRYFTVSRGRAALIDVGGTVGVFIGIAIENVVSQTGQVGMQGESERTANYSLGGMAAGLILAGILTRNMDAPDLSVTPVVSKAATTGNTSTTTFGLGGAF